MLTVEGLSAGYGALEVLRDVSFMVPDGGAVAILGANGAGKTTLLRALSGLIRTRAGAITMGDERIERLPAEQRVRRGLALVPEGRELFPSLTVRENLIMGAFTRRNWREVETDIERVLATFPRLRDRLSSSAASLSGGEGQMLSIGRALMSRPRVLLLDEPSHGLAPAIVETVFEAIARLNRDEGLAVALVEQNARMALSIVSSAYVLQGGVIALHGATDELARDPSVRQLYLGGEAEPMREAESNLDSPLPVGDRSPASAQGEQREESSVSFLPGIQSRTVATSRLRTHVLTAGPETGEPVVFIHGNVASSRFFEEILLALPEMYWGVAPDLRGFGRSETKPVDATRGVRDFADDLRALFEELRLTGERKPHLVGWSMGGGVAMRYAIDHTEDVATLTLIDPLPPFGYGSTKDVNGTLCWPDGAGSGAGATNAEYVRRLLAGDRTQESPSSPRSVMNALYFKPPFHVPADREEVYVDEMLRMAMGDDNYPGESAASPNWPGVRPGTRGVNNALAATHCDLSGFAGVSPRPPVLWVRGADDQIVADASPLDFGTLGRLGFVPGWPGAEVFPSQPMVAQTRAILERYREAGGAFGEVVIAECGHSPHIEKPEEFRARFFAFLAAHAERAKVESGAESNREDTP